MGSKSKERYPLEICKINETENAEVFKDVKGGFMKYYVRVGPQGYFYPDPFVDLLPQIYNLELRPNDVFVATFPKAGTTWTQELVWIVANNCDYETAKAVPLFQRFPFVEFSVFCQNDVSKGLIKQAVGADKSLAKVAAGLSVNGPELIAKMPSPRFIKTHQPFSLLPPAILDKAKVVYVTRDPRDVAVSYFHHHRTLGFYGYTGEFKDFWELFKKDMVEYSPFFKHFREAWALKDHPNMLFLSYEELSKDLSAAIRRVACFLGKAMSEKQVAALCDHLKFDNFKKNKAVNYEILSELGIIPKGESVVRKGKTGDWRDYFDEQMAEDAEQWIKEGLRGIDLKFQA